MLAIGYLAPGDIFVNMLQLKHFGSYFERILNRKWLLSYRNLISATEMLECLGACSPRKF